MRWGKWEKRGENVNKRVERTGIKLYIECFSNWTVSCLGRFPIAFQFFCSGGSYTKIVALCRCLAFFRESMGSFFCYPFDNETNIHIYIMKPNIFLNFRTLWFALLYFT